MSDWISVEDRMPEPGTTCLVVHGKEVEISYLNNRSIFLIAHLRGGIVTHWMPLPEPPNNPV